MANLSVVFLFREATEQNIQSENNWPKEKAKTFCHSTVVGLFHATNYGTYALVAALELFICVACCSRVRKHANSNVYQGKEKWASDLPKEEAKFLKVLRLGIENEDKKVSTVVSTKLKKGKKKKGHSSSRKQ